MAGILSLKARYVFPVSGEPVADETVTIDGERIVAVGGGAAHGEVTDLGNVAILPGLVNAHTHLELSDLAEPLGTPGMSFADWLRLVMVHHGKGGDANRAIRQGYRESLLSGTTFLGEIVQPDWSADLLPAEGPDTTVFLELIAPTAERVASRLAAAEQHVGEVPPSSRWRPGLSPHAPYSVHPDLLASAVSRSADKDVPLAMHLAEVPEELELLRTRSGPLRELLEELGAWQPGLVPPGTRVLDYLKILSAASRVLVIHGNYLDDEEILFLANRAEHMAVVYCPRTHAFFGHTAYPLEKMLLSGVTVALGTDSRASSPDLSLLEEMRAAAEKHPSVARDVILRLATLQGAKALECDRELGSLEPGKRADLAVVGLPDRDAADPFALLFESAEPVVATWSRGQRLAGS